MSVDQIVNYSRIDDLIATSGQPEEHELQWISEAGYTTVINLALHDAEYSLTNEADSVTALGMNYVHIPVIWLQPNDDDLDRFFHCMHINHGARLFIHCAANRRVSVFLSLYFMAQNIWSFEKAKQHIHSIWTPDDHWLVYFNRQMQRLNLE